MAEHNDTGRTGEMLAAAYLEARGLLLLHTNWRSGRLEIDLVMSEKDTLHFVEVKTATGKNPGFPERRVNAAKMQKLRRGAEAFLEAFPQWKFIQFDILSVVMHDGGQEDFFLIEDIG
jgi:putative endonuclease